MSTFQERVINELDELTIKLDALQSFIDKGRPDFISIADWALLVEQESHMVNYELVLKKRVSKF